MKLSEKVFYLDTETTGLIVPKHDIIQLAYIVEINHKVEEEGEFLVQPFSYNNIEQGALDINKRTIEEIKTFPEPRIVHPQILTLLDKYVDKYNKQDKFIPAGYQVDFDIRMFNNFFKKSNHKYFWSYFDYHKLDPITFIFMLEYKGLIKLESHHLVDVCKYFGIEINAHDALSDIQATRKLIYKLMEYLKEIKQ